MQGYRNEEWFKWHTPENQEIAAEGTERGMARDAFIEAAKAAGSEGVPAEVVEALSSLQIEPAIWLQTAIRDARNFRVLKNSGKTGEVVSLIFEIHKLWEENSIGNRESLQRRNDQILGRIKKIVDLIRPVK